MRLVKRPTGPSGGYGENLPAPFGELLRLGLEVSHVNSPPLEHGAPSDGATHAGNWEAEVYWNRAVVSGRPQGFAVESENDRVVGPGCSSASVNAARRRSFSSMS